MDWLVISNFLLWIGFIAMAIINSREHLKRLFEAKERKVAFIQDYMNKTQAVQ